MTSKTARPGWLVSFLVVFALAFLTGCQLLGNNQSQVNDTVVISSTTMDFGKVAVGNRKSLSNTISNFKTTSVTIATISGVNSDFQVSGIALPLTLAAGQQASFTVTCQPSKVGNTSATVQFSDNSQTVVSMTAAADGVNPGQLGLNPSSVNFGSVKAGSSQSSTVTLTNTGSTDLTIDQATLSGASFTMSNLALPLTLAPGGTASVTVTFAPTGAGNFSGSVSFSSTAAAQANAKRRLKANGANGADTTVLALTGVGLANQGTLSANPASLSFGNVLVGSSSTKSETLTNTGSGPVTISQASVTGAGFSISGLSLPTTLTQNQSVTFNVKFSPATAGAVTGNVAITSDGTNSPLNIAVSGTGTTPGTLTANPANLAFGSVLVGSNSSLTETLTNTGGSTVTISQANVTGAGFSISGLTLPATIAVGASKSFTVKFTPTASGAVTGNIALVSDASNSPLNIGLSGDGLNPGSLTAVPSTVNFGNVVLNNTQTVPVVVTNTGGASVSISNVAVTGSGFSFTGPNLPVALNAGQSATFNAKFTPTSAGNKSGSLTITSNANNPTLTVPLQGTGVTPGQVGANPSSLAFGNIVIGNNKSLNETLTNTGGTSVTISAATITGSGMSFTGLTLPVTLPAGQSTTFSVKFAPTAAGAISGNLTITSDGANPTLTIAVTGTGVAPGTLSANPTSLAFGSVQTGSNATLSETLTNTGGVNVIISQANVTGAGFSISGLTLPATLTPSQTVTFSVKFAPTNAGAVSGNLAIVSDASNSPTNIPLTGTGVAPGQLTPNPTSLSFGNVVVGNSKNLTETLTNSGGSTVTISAASVSGAGMSLSGISVPVTLNAGQSTTFTVTFAPTAAGAVSGNVTITSNGSNPNLNIGVSGTGVAPGMLTANPTSLAFGNVQVSSSSSLTEMLTNSGGTSVTISQANVTGAGFSISGLTLPTTLNAGQSVTFTAAFAPTGTGSASGNIAIISTGTNSPLNIAMTGTGTPQGQLSVSPATLNFGTVTVGLSSGLTGTLNATGASVTVTSAGINNSEFVLSGITFPKTIAAGGSATYTVTFTPNAAGSTSATLTFQSNASNAPTTQSLTGTGQAPLPHSVDLSWNASPTPGVIGYNVYRRNPSGSYGSPLNGSPNGDLTYTDNGVTAGKTYFYVVRAVDSNNVESGNSNEVQAVIPTP